MIRFGKAGYIFVINYDGIYLSHIRKEYIGKSYTENLAMGINENVVPDMIEIAKNGNGFYSYIQNKPNSESHKWPGLVMVNLRGCCPFWV